MRFLCLGYYEPERYAALGEAEQRELATHCAPHDRALRRSGRLVEVASLGEVAIVSLRPGANGPTVTDGPFVESKELVGSYFIVEADDLEDAVRIASMHPAAQWGAHLGWGVEVRAIEHTQAPAGSAQQPA
jgi:hypothetical protein